MSAKRLSDVPAWRERRQGPLSQFGIGVGLKLVQPFKAADLVDHFPTGTRANAAYDWCSQWEKHGWIEADENGGGYRRTAGFGSP